MPLTIRRPMTASVAHKSSRPIGDTFSVRSMKSAVNRSENMSSDVKTKRILPCAGVRMLPVMFLIQPSVPSSTAPTMACVTNSTNRSTDPTEKFVHADDDEEAAATPQQSRLHVDDVKNALPEKNARMPPS